MVTLTQLDSNTKKAMFDWLLEENPSYDERLASHEAVVWLHEAARDACAEHRSLDSQVVHDYAVDRLESLRDPSQCWENALLDLKSTCIVFYESVNDLLVYRATLNTELASARLSLLQSASACLSLLQPASACISSPDLE